MTTQKLRFGIIFVLVPFAAAWIYDLPQILSIPLYEMYGFAESTILMCYSAYSIPNILFVLVGGFIVNKYGSIVFMICL